MGPAAPALLTVAADSATVTLNQTAALDLAAGSDVGIIAQAGHSVNMSLSAGNIGSVTLRNLSLVLTHHLSDLECSLHDAQDAAPSAAPTAVQPVDGAAIELGVLGVGQVLRCTGRLVLDTAAFEAGDALFSVAGSAAGPGALVAVHSSQEVRVTAAHAPALTVELSPEHCVLPTLGGTSLWCPVRVRNAGNVGITGVSALAASGNIAAGCAVSELEPGTHASCQLQQIVPAAAFAAADLDASAMVQVAISASATSRSNGTAALHSNISAALSLAPVLLRSVELSNAMVYPDSVATSGASGAMGRVRQERHHACACACHSH